MEILLGKRLKELREERGLTQKQLSTVLHLNSVTYIMKNHKENHHLQYLWIWQNFSKFQPIIY